MRHFFIEELLDQQRGLFAVWQCDPDVTSHHAIAHAVRDLRQVHDGVYLSGHGPITDWQRWKAATLTTPSTYLADWSAASFGRMRDREDRWPTTVVRPGSGGLLLLPPRDGRVGSLRVRRSTTLKYGTTVTDGIPRLTIAKTLLDLMPKMGDERAGKMVREVLRLGLATAADLEAQVLLSSGLRGVARLRALVDEYGGLQAQAIRAKSDPEILAVAILRAAGIDLPEVNVVVDGGEGDLVFRDRRLIVELDGPQFHQFPELDAIKQRRWEDAGWTVRRLPTGDVFTHPLRLIAAATDPIPSAPHR
jgi:hypothetical protein